MKPELEAAARNADVMLNASTELRELARKAPLTPDLINRIEDLHGELLGVVHRVKIAVAGARFADREEAKRTGAQVQRIEGKKF